MGKELSEGALKRIEEVRQGKSTDLYLGQEDLEEIPEDVFGLSQLETLELADNRLRVVPKRIQALSKLQRLDLTHNPIQDMPDIPGLALDMDAYLRCRNSLTPAHIRGLEIAGDGDFSGFDLLPTIAALPRLRQLTINQSGDDQWPVRPVQEVIDGLGQLCSLENLQLSGVLVTQVPPGIRELKALYILRLERAGLRECPDWIAELQGLLFLVLAGNELKTLPVSLARLQKLSYLYLTGNPLGQVPTVIFEIGSLKLLSIDRCGLTQIPPQILQLENLTDLVVDGQPIETPPLEVVNAGLEAIKNYWRQRQETGVDYLCEAKLLIIGEPGAGKTSLAKKIQDANYQLQPEETSTEGIEVVPWSFPSAIRDQSGAVVPRDYRVNIWDFGGQEIYHATHQFFLTHRSLYVLVADDRKEDTDFNYWLQIVELLSDGSPLLIVQNEKQDRRRDIDFSSLRARFSNLKNTFRVNLADNRGLKDLVAAIRQELERLPHIGAPLPRTWKEVREDLERDSRNHISLDEYLEICQKHGFHRREDKLQLSGYLHDLGICLHFQDDPVLKSTVILKPRWGTDAVYRVLDDRAVFDRGGRFGTDDLARIWSEAAYAGMRHELLRLMMRFQLCYQLPDSDVCIAPQLLPSTQPSYSWPEAGNLTVRYEYDFMPKGLVTRLMVALNHRIADQNQVWKGGAIFQRDGTRAEVVEDYPKRRIAVRANGPDARSLVAIVDDHLERIHASFTRLKYEKYLPCNCRVCQTAGEPHSFSLTALKKFAGAGRQIQCQESFDMVDAGALLRDLFPGAIRVDARMPLDRERPEPRKVFVSYKWTDESIKLVDQIEAVLKDHGIALLRDRNEVAYKDSIRDFMKRIGTGDAIVVILSNQYFESEYCMFELSEIAAHGDLLKRVFPVVLEDAGIYKPAGRLKHIKYWEDQTAELKASMGKVDPTNLRGVQEDLNLYAGYRATIDGILTVLGDMNPLAVARHAGSGFQEIVGVLEKRLTA